MKSLLIIGAAGDLTSRHLIPALVELSVAGQLDSGLRIRGADQNDFSTSSFARYVWERLDSLAADLPVENRADVLGRLDYIAVDATAPAGIKAALGDLPGPVACYLALPPLVFDGVVRALDEAGLPPGSRIVVEKPFGIDQDSARKLNRLLIEVVGESNIFRIDHFLAQQTVQNIIGLRFANRIFEPLWSAQHIEQVDIVWDETLTLENRAQYYDRAGALRDMVQNHLLQLLCLVAMEPPLTLSPCDFHGRKADVLRAVRTLGADDVARHTVRARYTSGKIGKREIGNYADEPGVDPARNTETYAEMTCWIDNWRWAGVPFMLRSGKALAKERNAMVITFRDVPHPVFGQSHDPARNVLELSLNPDRIGLTMNLNGAGDPFDLERASLSTELAPQRLPAYARLLLDVLAGEPTMSISAAEAEESWRIIDPVLDAWSRDVVPLREYPSGSAPVFV
ncbi:glucose-6-phosphate dehydrogenase [Mycobacterium ostraviense]|uniref:Glucose-6-phosphate 1-dehydrogenase n=1 Tax=Mycobacterium ostraviense TaxID=2738409 RepID=A0A164DFP5_9MYCO|nr:glucose-6-phosphate dehydrogenase [Mycobacterium ostraviense]KZS65943.1 glucose-6-phosphate dehydrogenase [Mycobacterium ostraviense]UGT91063.1 glucose-6-phosphate dehydrogenase [Mycobacterium ostraviense]